MQDTSGVTLRYPAKQTFYGPRLTCHSKLLPIMHLFSTSTSALMDAVSTLEVLQLQYLYQYSRTEDLSFET